MIQNKKNASKRKKQDTTLKKISEITGFACSTISAVLNNNSKCYASVKTKERILKVADELNYHPNLLYRGLRTQETNTIGLIVPNLHVNVSLAKIELIEDLLWKAGYHLFIGYSQNDTDKEEALLKDFIGRRVDGIILVVGDERRKQRRELQYLIKQDFPLITIGKLLHFDCSFVSTSYYEGGQLAARHLKELGHKKTLLFNFLPSPVKNLRMDGFRDAAKKYNMEIDEVCLLKKSMEIMPILSEEHTITKSISLFKQILSKNNAPTGVFASNDTMALGVIKAAQELNIRVPEELSVIGFDDISSYSFTSIPITTFRQKKEEISKKVVKFLMNKIEGEEETRHEYVSPELIIRSSTGPAKQQGKNNTGLKNF